MGRAAANRWRKWAAVLFAVGVVTTGTAATGPSPAPSAATTIHVTPGKGEHPISRQLFGANNNYAADGSGMYDEKAAQVYPSFTDQVTESKFTAMRFPGGTMANTYHFARAIGPQSGRTDNVNGVTADPEPLADTFGPDEYGRFLDKTGMTGNLVLDFATGTPREAADFVEYMTARVGTNPNGGTAWARVRARNGHPAPYNISRVEVGNEMSIQSQRYWMAGAAKTSCSDQVDCLYANGGTTHFTKQPVGGYADWRQAASVSSGAAGQKFFVRYAPVVPESQTVYVNGAAWAPVASLSTAAAGANVYQIDAAHGTITFGNGTHGAIPPSGAAISVSYDSGPHKGFSDFYDAIKKVNPNVKVCSSLYSTEFLKLMGSTRPYDCVVRHEYSKGPAGTLDANDYHDQFMSVPDQLGSDLASVQSQIKQAAGPRAADISTVVTEYGELGSGHPQDTQHYHLSLDQGLYVGDLLRKWAELGVPLAEKAKLTDYVWSSPPPSTQSVGFPENAMIAGPGPRSVVEPTAEVMGLMSSMTGTTFVDSDVSANPGRATSTGAVLPALTTLASRDKAGHLFLIVINRDRADDVHATVDTGRRVHGDRATVDTVDGPSFLSYNTPADPNTVHLSRTKRDVGSGSFSYTFPAHSVTAFRFSGRA